MMTQTLMFSLTYLPLFIHDALRRLLLLFVVSHFFPVSDIEVSNRHGHTCLMIACYKGHYKIANYLLSLKADINKKSVKGNTALHDCAESGNLDIFKMLIQNGAKMEIDSYGKFCPPS
jgi:ankyrin repeat protein